MRKLLYLGVIILTLFVSACSSEEPVTPSDPNDQVEDPGDELVELTLEELAYYDGTDGKPAYIAVDGKIYDVSNSSFWLNGGHNGYQAGQDLTDPIMNESPHGISTLSRVPIVGTLISGD